MFERFSEQARQVVVLALDEARSLGHDRIGSEHVLLGLLRLDDDLVELLGESSDMRRRVVELVGEGEGEPATPGQLPFTAHAKRSLELALHEAGSAQVGPWQVALGLLALPDDATALRALRAQGVSPAEARNEILGLGTEAPERDEPGGLSAASRRVLETAARHAEDAALGPEHLLLALVLEVPELTLVAIGVADGGAVHERLAGLLEGPEPSGLHAPRRDIAVLESALRCAAGRGSEEVTPVEIMLGLLEVAPDVVARAAVDLDAAAARTRRFGRPTPPSSSPARERLPLPGGPPAPFSHGAHSALERARDEAERLGHSYIGTEHLLVALVQDEEGAAGRVLAELSIGLSEVRARVEHIVPREEESRHLAGSTGGQLPFTPRVSHIVSLAVREMAVRADATEVDTGDLLLAIERDGEGVATQVLAQLGAPGPLVRRRTLGALAGDATPVPAGRLTASARRALLLADAEASALGHTWIGCEHLLLALARQGEAAAALALLGVTAEGVHAGLVDLGGSVGFGEPVRTPRLVRTIECAEQIAREAGRAQADDGDLLLGLGRESAGVARALLGPATDEASLRRALGDR